MARDGNQSECTQRDQRPETARQTVGTTRAVDAKWSAHSCTRKHDEGGDSAGDAGSMTVLQYVGLVDIGCHHSCHT